ncbi:hypothetical protein, partial [Pseudomonas syringae group genomosp. 7]|uniref:hypothetical protein n=1 Tax=Pseudomonas syringae group genomosp. 7 TaxID=251699 RepID=UPI00377066FF
TPFELISSPGCLPFTPGLSLDNALGKEKCFSYYGVDCYQSMRTLGSQMATSARASKELHPMTTYEFTNYIDKIKFENISGN